MEVHKLEPKVKWQQTIIYRSPTTGVTCSGQLKLATVLEFSQYNRSDSLGVKPPLY